MLTVNITYHAETRMMEITSLSTGENGDNAVATTGDNLTTRLQFTFDDPEGTLSGFTKRLDFSVLVTDEDGHAYNPYIILDSEDGVVLPEEILSNVKCGILPIELVLLKDVEGSDTLIIQSLNKINLAINKAIGADAVCPSDLQPKIRDAISQVTYDNNTFTFTRLDGVQFDISLTDLSEEHFEVETVNELTGLSQAETGDTATVTSTGVWYKLYGTYSNIEDWKVMSGNITINGETTGSPVFYAPVNSGTAGQFLESQGEGNAPEWVNPPFAKKIEEWKIYADFSTSISIHHNLSDIPSSVMVFIEDDGDYTEVLADVVADENTITVTFSQSPAYGTGIKIKALV